MDDGRTFDREAVENLLARWPITDRPPWCTEDEDVIEDFYWKISSEICTSERVMSHINSMDYRRGFSSYVETWFYRPTIDFAVAKPTGLRQEFVGLLVAFNASSPCYCLMETEQSWDTASGGHGPNPPSLGIVDRFTNSAVSALLPRVQSFLAKHGLIRLSKEDLTPQLPPDLAVDTLLSDPPFRIFDALFHLTD